MRPNSIRKTLLGTASVAAIALGATQALAMPPGKAAPMEQVAASQPPRFVLAQTSNADGGIGVGADASIGGDGVGVGADASVGGAAAGIGADVGASGSADGVGVSAGAEAGVNGADGESGVGADAGVSDSGNEDGGPGPDDGAAASAGVADTAGDDGPATSASNDGGSDDGGGGAEYLGGRFDALVASDIETDVEAAVAQRVVGASVDVGRLLNPSMSGRKGQVVARLEIDVEPASQSGAEALDAAKASRAATFSGRGPFGAGVALGTDAVEDRAPAVPPAAIRTAPLPKGPAAAPTKTSRAMASLVESARLSARLAARAAIAAEQAKSAVAARKASADAQAAADAAVDAASQVRALADGRGTLDALKAVLAAERASLDARVNAQAAADAANKPRGQATAE